jgi:hypothetical protein
MRFILPARCGLTPYPPMADMGRAGCSRSVPALANRQFRTGRRRSAGATDPPRRVAVSGRAGTGKSHYLYERFAAEIAMLFRFSKEYETH